MKAYFMKLKHLEYPTTLYQHWPFHTLGDNEVAYELIKDIEPTTAQEYILKAIANAVIGQERNSVR